MAAAVGTIYMQSDISLVAAYVLLLLGIVVESIASAKKGDGAGAVRDQTILVSVGTCATIVIAIFGVLTFLDAQQRSVYATTLQLFVALEQSRPANARFCRCALADLEPSSTDLLRKREAFSLNDRATTLFTKCFLDQAQDKVKGFISDGKITPAGASAFADRLNRMFEADENIALAANYGIASKEMVAVEMARATTVDQLILTKYARAQKLYPHIWKIDVTRYLTTPGLELCSTTDY